MAEEVSLTDAFIMFFSISDKLRHNVLITSTTRKNIALLESLTYRQQKALVAVMMLTEHAPSGVNLRRLSERLTMTVPATSVLVETMVQNKIFLRIASQTDRRSVCIKLSDFGEKLFEALKMKTLEQIEKLTVGIPEEDLATFARVLAQLHEKLFTEVA